MNEHVMLVLHRRVGGTVQIGPDIRVTVMAVNSHEVRLGIVAPPTLLPPAEEVHERAEDQSGRDHISWR